MNKVLTGRLRKVDQRKIDVNELCLQVVRCDCRSMASAYNFVHVGKVQDHKVER